MKFYGELLVFVLLFITNFRVFFVKSARHDPLVVLAPATFIIALLQIFSFGIDVFTALGFIIALLVLLSNFHAIFRYSENLYVDHYSPLMMIWAVLTSLISAVAIVAVIVFAPLELNKNTLKITETEYRLQGSFRGGFTKAPFYMPADAFLYKFEPAVKEENQEDKIILFFPDKLGDTEHYKPYLQLLANKGFTVYSADFYADDCRWIHTIEDMKIMRRTALIVRSELKAALYESQREFYTYNISLEIKELLSLLEQEYGNNQSYYFVCDKMGPTAIKDLIIKQKSKVKDTLFIDSIAEYETSGYGFIKQTDPLFALYKGYKRDSHFFEAKLLAEKTAELFMDSSEQAGAGGEETVEGALTE